MKKSNWIILAIAAVISIFLLWLWFYLELNRIDEPLDLVLSIIWWLLIALTIFVIYRVEKARRQRIRTMYVGKTSFFNSEAGIIPYTDKENLVARIEQTLEDLKYDFTKEDLPDLEEHPMDFVVRTTKFKLKETEEQETLSEQAQTSEQQEEEQWEGSVVFVERENEDEEHPFENKEELFQTINLLPSQA